MGERGICSSSSSLPLRLVWIIVPLIVVSGLVGLRGTRTSNWVFTSNHYPWVWSSVIQSSSSTIFLGPNGTLRGSEEEGSGTHSDLNPRLAVADHHGEEALSSDESILKRSSSPPVVKNEESSNTVMNGPHINESHTVPMMASSKRKLSKLMKLEVSLGQARAAIKEATTYGNQTQDPDFVPTGPMYWNTNAFQRSYLEMEKQFKVFVYEEGEHPIFHNGPCRSIYAMEGNFIYHMEVSKFRTKDPEKAHVFFLPFSVSSIVRFVYERESHNWAPLKQTVKDYVDLVGRKYPYWNRSLGADHFMLACHDWGPELSSAVPDLYKNSIRALCNANTSEGFNPTKDVSFPEILLHDGTMNRLLGGPSPSKRPVLVFFAGGVHGPVRPILLEHWEDRDEDVQVHKYLPKSVSYYGMMRKSKYCICASGYEVASPRMVEALYMGCIPVLIKDHYVAPFSDVLNWKSFSVEVAVKDIPNLKKILTGISTRQYIRLHRRGLQVRRHFEVNLPPKRFDVFHMILHSVWLRRLNVRVRDFEAAS
ncbi:Glycosyltransferase [Actinidia chinensis var. chinensis]|uniref:Glycosyltransferase n=1 Tax=Actinidia chinensis var. chinensis TaxID=1590841 RepID=A0A2R6RY46_ACTCC|nr:Glycosyltransferase [Actinidia chinensis var. chinensis]